jgi:hypothetical protein
MRLTVYKSSDILRVSTKCLSANCFFGRKTGRRFFVAYEILVNNLSCFRNEEKKRGGGEKIVQFL